MIYTPDICAYGRNNNMDLKKFTLGVGPMSPEVLGLCLEYSYVYNYPLMIIASRNQVDYDSGYSFTTSNLVKFIKHNSYYDPDRVLICRDHCGPYYSDLDQNQNLDNAISRCLNTIESDIKSGFNLIHIDVGRVPENDQYSVAQKLFTYAMSKNPNIMFEFGTEDNNGNMEESLQKLAKQLTFLETLKPNIKYVVSQTGSLTKHKQVGNFDVEVNKKTSDLIHGYDLLFKEHNADYLDRNSVQLRRQAGVDAINIAPQLACIQSGVIHKLGSSLGNVYENFVDSVLEAEYWKKWTTTDVTDSTTKFVSSAHYMFNSNLYKELRQKIDNDSFNESLEASVFSALDEYRLGYVDI